MTSDLAADLREIVGAERERFGVPGYAVLAVADGEVVLCEGFGLRDVDRNLPVTEGTLFPIGSSTKTFTAAVCAALVEAGLLAWERPVREYLPGFRMADPVATEQLTVFDMLCHRSGLPRHDLLWYSAEGDMSRTELVRALADLQPNRRVRETWQYNNLLYATAGELAGRLTGRSYESAVRERILDPLRMPRTNFSVDDTHADPDAARPYALRELTGEELHEVSYARLDLVGAAGNINSCVEEMSRWLLTLLGRGVDGHPPLLSPSALAYLQAPAVPMPEASPLAVGKPVGYGLGLILEDYRGHRIRHHGGNINGFSSQVSFIPEAGCGVVVLTNRNGTALRDAVPFLIYDRILGLPVEDHGEALLEREKAIYLGMSQSMDRSTSDSNGLPPVRPLADYAGTYRHPAYGPFEVGVDGPELAGRYRALSGPLRHRHLEVFNLLVTLVGVETPLPVQFTHDFDGDVTALLCRLEPSVDPIRFERVPDDAHLTDDVLDGLAGTYRLGPLSATVTRRGERGLAVAVADAPPTALELVHDLVFTADGSRVEFADGGRLVTASGEFVRD